MGFGQFTKLASSELIPVILVFGKPGENAGLKVCCMLYFASSLLRIFALMPSIFWMSTVIMYGEWENTHKKVS